MINTHSRPAPEWITQLLHLKEISDTLTPTLTQSYKGLLDFAPPLEHGDFFPWHHISLWINTRSVTTHNLLQTRQTFPRIVTHGSDLTTFCKWANQMAPNGGRRKRETKLNPHQKFCQPIKVIRFCAECKTRFLPGSCELSTPGFGQTYSRFPLNTVWQHVWFYNINNLKCWC